MKMIYIYFFKIFKESYDFFNTLIDIIRYFLQKSIKLFISKNQFRKYFNLKFIKFIYLNTKRSILLCSLFLIQ